jgi:hypothetical protein
MLEAMVPDPFLGNCFAYSIVSAILCCDSIVSGRVNYPVRVARGVWLKVTCGALFFKELSWELGVGVSRYLRGVCSCYKGAAPTL